MDTVKTFSFGGNPAQTLETSAADLFNSALPAAPVAPAEPAAPVIPDQSVDTSVEDLLKGLTEPKDGDEPKDDKPQDVVDNLDKKAAGRPTEKLSEATRNEIVALIEAGELEGFTDGKYETKKDLQDLLQANKEKWREEYKTAAWQTMYEELNPGMKFVADYAKDVQNPQDLVPFLTAYDNAVYAAELDATIPEHQEQIVRQVLNIRGIPQDQIEADIADLKERDLLTKRAASLKPQLDQFTQQELMRVQKERQLEVQREQEFWKNHTNAVKTSIMDAKDLDGIKLKKEHKDLVYQALTTKTNTGDIAIYNLVETLLSKNDFKTLAKMVLVGADSKSFENYIRSSQKQEDAQHTIRVLGSQGGLNGSIVEPLSNQRQTVERPTRKGFGWV